ncbi:MAG: DUF11 domain-containing protein, partial [Propionibacteriaceae bacterium]|nr:DUF11 domain-containing protein [Propionibacteriaceae bacterium]
GEFTGADAAGTEATASDDAVLPLTPRVGITVTKVALPTTVTAVGDEVVYTVTAENTGSADAENVMVKDPGPGAVVGVSGTWSGVMGCVLTTVAAATGAPFVNDGSESVPPGGVVTCTASFTVDTLAAGTSGTMTNTVTVSADNMTDETAQARVTVVAAEPLVPPSTGLGLKKTIVTDGVPKVGDMVTFKFLVRNTGDTPVAQVHIVEIRFTGDKSKLKPVCPSGEPLRPGGEVTCEAEYQVTQADVVLGYILNTAVASWDPDETNTSHRSLESTTEYDWAKLMVTKVGTPNWATGTYPKPGDTITYDFTVRNPGRTDVSEIVFDDPLIPQSAITCTGSVPPLAKLAVGASVTCTGTYALTQADINAGGVVNTVTVSGKDPNGHSVEAWAEAPLVVAKQNEAWVVAKTADRSTARLGDVITYTYTIANTGNVAATELRIKETEFTGKGTAPDPKDAVCTLNGTLVSLPTLALPVGETVKCTLTYTVVAADVAPGKGETVRVLRNSATVVSDKQKINPPPPPPPATAEVTLIVQPAVQAKTGGSVVGGEASSLAGVLAGLLFVTAGVAFIIVRRKRRS